jgi:hypothetical protein
LVWDRAQRTEIPDGIDERRNELGPADEDYIKSLDESGSLRMGGFGTGLS